MRDVRDCVGAVAAYGPAAATTQKQQSVLRECVCMCFQGFCAFRHPGGKWNEGWNAAAARYREVPRVLKEKAPWVKGFGPFIPSSSVLPGVPMG